MFKSSPVVQPDMPRATTRTLDGTIEFEKQHIKMIIQSIKKEQTKRYLGSDGPIEEGSVKLKDRGRFSASDLRLESDEHEKFN